ncbi:Rieske (2Fe-2S) protein [Cupriavidus basilensis]|uniref:Rieske (2Fe-2S) protein n=1 Tax=Cupriavidus basilensis TaxID=68895 RepID=UPI00157AB3B7|nr:Rieske 2Fe-2S domain-containing protein [Cupriavidus basilensis]NUA28600.1 Rieske 2Fe-2S domain-containing protein [Cupriavidus basilensis]
MTEVTLALSDIPDGRCRLLRIGTHEVAVFHVNGHVHALADSCPHASASLAGGKVEGTTVQCRAHGLRFNLATGHMVGNPALAVKCYPATVSGGMVTVAAPDD